MRRRSSLSQIQMTAGAHKTKRKSRRKSALPTEHNTPQPQNTTHSRTNTTAQQQHNSAPDVPGTLREPQPAPPPRVPGKGLHDQSAVEAAAGEAGERGVRVQGRPALRGCPRIGGFGIGGGSVRGLREKDSGSLPLLQQSPARSEATSRPRQPRKPPPTNTTRHNPTRMRDRIKRIIKRPNQISARAPAPSPTAWRTAWRPRRAAPPRRGPSGTRTGSGAARIRIRMWIRIRTDIRVGGVGRSYGGRGSVGGVRSEARGVAARSAVQRSACQQHKRRKKNGSGEKSQGQKAGRGDDKIKIYYNQRKEKGSATATHDEFRHVVERARPLRHEAEDK